MSLQHVVQFMAQHARHFFAAFCFFHEPGEHHHIPARQREGIDDVALHHSHFELIGVILNLRSHTLGHLSQRCDRWTLLHHFLMAEKIPIGRFAQLLLPLYRNPTHCNLDEQIGPEPEPQHRGQDYPTDHAPGKPAPVPYLTHLLRNFCKRKTEMVRRRFPKSPNDVRILQIQRPFSMLTSPFHNKLVMVESACRNGEA